MTEAAILTTLVSGASAQEREAAIASCLVPSIPTGIILEGLPAGVSRLDDYTDFPLDIARIAPGCMCCTGNLTMKVTLNRMLRRQPKRLYISVASSAHLTGIRAFFLAPPYDKLLHLSHDLLLGAAR